MKVAIVACEFNWEITGKMEKRALEYCKAKKIQTISVKVPGAFDAPLAIKRLLKDKSVNGVAVLGAIIKGDTKHDEIIGHALAKTIHDLTLEFGKPIGFGVIGHGATWSQAEKRAEDYAERAVDTVIALSK